MKKFLILFLLIGLSIELYAQKKRVQFEVGLNYPIGLEKDGTKESHVGLYLNGIYNIKDNPLSVKLRVSYESYSIVMKEYMNSPFNGRSIVILPAVNYNFPVSSKLEFYAGVGTGVTLDNTDRGVFNTGMKVHAVVAPQVGMNVFKHLNVSAQYSITQKDFSRLMLGVGYIF